MRAGIVPASNPQLEERWDNVKPAPNEAQRWLYTALILSMLIGYGFALLQIGATSGFSPGTVLDHFRGNEAEMMFAMEYGQLVKLSHIHMLGMPLILTPAAWVFAQTDFFTPRKRGLIIAAGYLGIVLDIGAWWGIVYGGAFFLVPLILGGLLLGSSLLITSGYSIGMLWFVPNQPEGDPT